jgi:hypothetical protein
MIILIMIRPFLETGTDDGVAFADVDFTGTEDVVAIVCFFDFLTTSATNL